MAQFLQKFVSKLAAKFGVTRAKSRAGNLEYCIQKYSVVWPVDDGLNPHRFWRCRKVCPNKKG